MAMKVRWCNPIMDQEMIDAAATSLRDEKLIMGESVLKFEEEFAHYCGVKHAISVSSGTNALFFTLLSLGANGKKYATAASSFIASSNSIVQAGGTPVFFDVNAEYTLSPERLEAPILNCSCATPEECTCAHLDGILPVHLYGHPCKMDEIMEIAEKRGIPVVEDACQAHGATYKGKKCGSIGTAGCFSFYSTKNMTVGGDGGMITTNDDKLAASIEKYRNCGRKTFYEHDVVGYTSRLNTANAAIGRVQLRHLDEWNEKRRQLAGEYFKCLENALQVTLPPRETADVKPAFHLFSIKHAQRDAFRDYLKNQGIETGMNYPVSLPLQPVYANLGHKVGDFPQSESLSKGVVCLPMHTKLTNEDVHLVCNAIMEFEEGMG